MGVGGDGWMEGRREEKAPFRTAARLWKTRVWAAGPPPRGTPPLPAQAPSHPSSHLQSLVEPSHPLPRLYLSNASSQGPCWLWISISLMHCIHQAAWGGNSVPHEGRGCASFLAVSPDPAQPHGRLDW